MEIHQLNYKSSPLLSLMCADDLIIFSQSAADLVNVEYFRKLNRERPLTINLNKTKKKCHYNVHICIKAHLHWKGDVIIWVLILLHSSPPLTLM